MRGNKISGRSPAPAALVADDDAELRDAVAGILESGGFEVLHASDGAEALAKALSSNVDIVLLDQDMPRKSGVEVRQALHEAGFAGPIIISSGADALDDPSQPGQRWLRKPFDAEELLGAVKEALADHAPEMAVVASPARPPQIGQLLSRAEEALVRQQNGISYSRHAELRDLIERLQSLDEEMLRCIDEASASFQQTLEHIVAAAQRPTRQDETLRIDLRTVLRGVRCQLDIAVEDCRHLSLDRCRPGYREVDLARLTRRVCRCFDGLARDREIDFEVVTPERQTVEADGEKLERVLVILLFQAFKHAPPGGAVECLLGHDPHEGEVSLEVSDSGPKIPPGQEAAPFQSSRVFDRTARLLLDDLALDLRVARQLVGLHGGTLTLRHRRSGCGFRATLPRWSARGVAVSDAPLAGVGELGSRAAEIAARELAIESKLGLEPVVTQDGAPVVLIVDGSRSIQRVLTECLQPELSVVSAFDGQEGLRLAIEMRPDLIIADVGLPGMGGDEMVRKIRGRRELSKIPILVLVTAKDPLQGAGLLEADGQDVVRKPFVLAEVRARVARLLAAKRGRDVLNEAAGHQDWDLERLAGDVLRRRRTDEITLKEAHDSRATAELESRVKSSFLRMMAHELRTPITAMHLQMRLLEREEELAHSPGLREGLARIARSSHRLVQLIDTCVEWARVESRRCHLVVETFDLAPLVSQVVGEFEAHVERKGIRVDVVAAAVPPLTSDRKLARLALLNLISYAVQNTDKGAVEVSVDATEGAHRVRVTDGGPPVAVERRQEIFAPLESMDDLSRQAGSGSGLGLYVVRDIVRAIGGDVVLDAAGNTFVLSLPGLPEDR